MHEVVEGHEQPGGDLESPSPLEPGQLDTFNMAGRSKKHEKSQKKVLCKDYAVEQSLSKKGRLVTLCLLVLPQRSIVVVIVTVDAGKGVEEKAEQVFFVKRWLRSVEDQVKETHDCCVAVVDFYSQGWIDLVGGAVEKKADEEDPCHRGEEGGYQKNDSILQAEGSLLCEAFYSEVGADDHQ